MKKRILVVDDEPLMVEMIKEALSRPDTELVGAANGEEAILYVTQNDVDLVISDIMMPKMLGTKLVHELKKINPFLQVIIITAYPTLQNIVEMLEAGTSDFLIKPFDIEKMRIVVSETFSRIERWRELREQWLQRRAK